MRHHRRGALAEGDQELDVQVGRHACEAKSAVFTSSGPRLRRRARPSARAGRCGPPGSPANGGRPDVTRRRSRRTNPRQGRTPRALRREHARIEPPHTLHVLPSSSPNSRCTTVEPPQAGVLPVRATSSPETCIAACATAGPCASRYRVVFRQSAHPPHRAAAVRRRTAHAAPRAVRDAAALREVRWQEGTPPAFFGAFSACAWRWAPSGCGGRRKTAPRRVPVRPCARRPSRPRRFAISSLRWGARSAKRRHHTGVGKSLLVPLALVEPLRTCRPRIDGRWSTATPVCRACWRRVGWRGQCWIGCSSSLSAGTGRRPAGAVEAHGWASAWMRRVVVCVCGGGGR